MGFLASSSFPFEANLNASEEVLRTVFITFAPFVKQTRQGDRIIVGGPLRLFVDAIQGLVGRRLVAVSAGEFLHGMRLENGTFTGLMGMIQREEIDFLLGPCIMTDERLALAETLPLDITSYRLLTWSPSKVIDPFNFVSVFTLEVWALILSSMVLLGILYWAMQRFCTPWSDEPKTSLIDSMWNIFARLFPQDAAKNQEDWYRLCMLIFLMTYSVVLMNFLSSQLTSAMTIKANEDYINTYQDILRFRDVRIYAEAGTSLTRIFTKPSNELFRKLRSRLIEVKGIVKHGTALVDMISEVAAKKRVIVGNPQMCQAVVITGLRLTGKCPKVQTSTESSGVMMGSAFSSYRLSRELRGRIRYATLTVREAGLYQKLIGYTVRAAEKCEAQTKTSAVEDIKPLMLQDLQGSFILLAIGIASSTIALAVEGAEETLHRRAVQRRT